MKKILLTLTFCGLTFIAKSQTVSVEQSTFGIQAGLLGIWGHHEARLSNQIALRSELGFDSGFWRNNYYDELGFLLTPVITLEPRWYYNLNKRESKSRRTDGNSGNFISIKTSYHPDWFVISNHDNIRIISDISIIPTWGIRRNIGNHFTYETGIGFGYSYIFARQAGYSEDEGDAALNLHLRVGYRF
ncbi:hypothetical protein [Sinomicrobium weinanense]|uniref:DUF3575 domain-containing protein n=1 Tax=Sinomicrobium weinanense TaxID=2842200 RepID=A0A926JPG3_9FLAO|nr:hypothetical protein [Sinomicrobium weinanense]MBC9794877.1 hypothetical protein [Sinomicrobium weinanense]MBU3125648.1 hypothetical protein [Sinomicrobium weinanense]